MADYNRGLVERVATFLHREVGEPEDDAAVDAGLLLDLIFADTKDAFDRLLVSEDYFILIHDEDEEVPTWELSILRNGTILETQGDTLNDVIEKAGI